MGGQRQDPVAWDDNFAQVSRDVLNIRYTLLPYLYTLMFEAHTKGSTVVRPLLHEFANDRNTWDIHKQFLWGPALLITPALDKGVTNVDGYVPNTRWYDFYTAKDVGVRGKMVSMPTPLDHINLHIRGGYILPWQKPENTTLYSRRNPLGLIVALSDSGTAQGSFFWDDGEGIGFHFKANRLLSHPQTPHPSFLPRLVPLPLLANIEASRWGTDYPLLPDLDSEVSDLRQDALSVIMASDLVLSSPPLGPGSTQCLLCLARVALSASVEIPELWGDPQPKSQLLQCLLKAPQYEVRELALEGVLRRLQEEEEDEEERGHQWLDQTTLSNLTSLALHETHPQCLAKTNQQFLKTVTEQSTEMEDLHSQHRQSKAELRTATAKVDEMTKVLQSFQDQMQRREEDVAEAQGREDAADRRLQQLQAALSQLEARLQAATQEAEAVRRDQTVWERKVGELQNRCSTLEEEKYEALAKVRESVQVAEEATLQREQVLLREKQKKDELEKTKEAIKQLIQDAAVRTRKESVFSSFGNKGTCLLGTLEVDNVRKQCNVQIHRMAEELSALQLECADKESQIERSLRERKAVEEELEKVYKEGRAEPEFRKIDALHQRCLDAERMKEDISLTLQSTKNRLKKMGMDYSEEISRCQEEVQRLQSSLVSARDDCVGVSEERLQLQRENLQLHKDMDELRKATMLVQKKAKQQLAQMEQEYSLKEQGLDARVQELEDSSRSSCADLTRLLAAQQKSTQRWKEEAKNLVQAFETKMTGFKGELNRQKQRSHELEMQLEKDHNTVAEYERQLAEYQEKASRLQRRLTQSEQKASTATQQLSMLASQRRKTAMVDPDTL
ncbi:sodium channel and clathrin linker 1-like [Notothenia coriiceps]|uniref:Sodium channel and clathrin linker 1-like n=1 Tax=Notothenia coriiceps TaxID=8208 RepID=A0A6I9Q4E5_9TELE|nr:PREDICTED: sodium channel and clathrin linker 1-like [Notothenia coriiceps]